MTDRPLELPEAIAAALEKVAANLATFSDVYPHDHTTHNIYQARALNGFPVGSNAGWTTGFWPGLLWLAYELTGAAEYRQAGLLQAQRFAQRLRDDLDLDHHDIGFLYTLACVAPWRLTGDVAARATAIRAADRLLTRYLERPGIIQAWGSLDDPQERGRIIVDSLMNLPLLYWAGETSGQAHYARSALRHAGQVRDYLVRPDGSTFHTFFFDETGAPVSGVTFQGAGDASCWSRGQAWAIYGFALSYMYTRDDSFLRAACRVADYFLANLPADGVAYWDLIFPDGSAEERDSSAASIAVCGLLELARQLPAGADAQRYQAAARRILASLFHNYSTVHLPDSNALLLQGVYNKPLGKGVNEGNLWGDYFYLEALMRLSKPDWKPCW
ncbi:MAG: glycoside hydrolase family 88 protein [Anaerolineales bacterium]